jgi:chemosensory pili system protein ChpC
MSDVEAALPVFVIPLQKSTIMLPNASVAEIIPYEPLQRVQDTPDWFIGVLAWRGVQVPVVSFEMLTVKRASFSLVSVSSASLVVLRALGGWQGFQYFALVAQALPRLVLVTADELFQVSEDVAVTELFKVRYSDLLVSIPDVDYIEGQIDQIAFETVL